MTDDQSPNDANDTNEPNNDAGRDNAQGSRPPEPDGTEETAPVTASAPESAWASPTPDAEQTREHPPYDPSFANADAAQHNLESSGAWNPQTSQQTPPPQYQQPATAPGPQNFAAPPAPPNGPSEKKRGLPAWVWPAVATLALVLGLLGGFAGGIAAVRWDDGSASSSNSGGLGDVNTASEAPLDVDNGSIAAVADELLPSTVQILAEFKGEEGGATGSGFVLDKQGHIVTNNHVVAAAAEDNGKIQVVDGEGNQRDATVVGRSPVYDLAVLKVEGDSNLKPAALGSSTELPVGAPVVALGSPLGLSSTVTSGIMSAKNRPVTTGRSDDESSFINALQTDAAINPGNSGGPLVNMQGQVVGVNSAIATTGGGALGGKSGNIGVGFAIPIEQVKVTAEQILENGEAKYPVIGATVQTGGNPQPGGGPIEEVLDDSPAQEAGLEDGDLVTKVNDDRVTDGISLIVLIRTYQPGDTVTLTVERDGQEREIDIKLDGQVG